MHDTPASTVASKASAKALRRLAVALIVAAAFGCNAWLLDGRLYFFSDDWVWLYYAEFLPWREYLAPLPDSIYNDRPVGAALVKLLYQVYGIDDHASYLVVLISIHALNCVLLQALARPYIGELRATLAALVAATWSSTLIAVSAPSTVFDLLGATFCLATLKLRERASRSPSPIAWDIAGALCYLVAIRTKEFALGMVVVIVLMSVVLERKPLRSALAAAWPYLLVFAVLLARYAYLQATAPPAADDPYRLQFSVGTVAASLRFALSSAFYQDLIGPIGAAAAVVALLVGLIASDARVRRIGLFSIAAFVIAFGPTLLLRTTESTGYHRLYLYTPHFFLALMLGALVTRRIVPTLAASVVGLGVVFLPFATEARRNVIHFYIAKSEVNRAQLGTAVQLLAPLPRGATVFVKGVEPYFNPFTNVDVNPLKLSFKDKSIRVVVEKPDEELRAGFCAADEPKRFLAYAGTVGRDITAEARAQCDARRP